MTNPTGPIFCEVCSERLSSYDGVFHSCKRCAINPTATNKPEQYDDMLNKLAPLYELLLPLSEIERRKLVEAVLILLPKDKELT